MQWCCTHSPTEIFMGRREKPRTFPQGLRAGCLLKWAGENTSSGCLSLFISVILFLPSSLFLGWCLCFLDFSFIRAFTKSFSPLSPSVILTQMLPLTEHSSVIAVKPSLEAVSAAVTPCVSGGAAICSQASSHGAPQCTVGYQSRLIPPLIWFDLLSSLDFQEWAEWCGTQSDPHAQRRAQF